MPKNIRRIRWSAKKVPWGLRFNERTGTFTGKPEEAGEFVVPVTAETNYGKFTQDVIIKIAPPKDNETS